MSPEFSPSPIGTGRQIVLVLMLLAMAALAAHAQSRHVHLSGATLAAPRAERSIVVPIIGRAPTIDGSLAPGEWDGAARVSGFTQLEPREGVSATDSTEVLVARDADCLYVAFVAFDAGIAGVRAARTPRDKIDAAGDYVGLLLDPQQTRTRG